MKSEDIKDYEVGTHCYGEILRVNGIDYEDLRQEDVLAFINHMFKTDINAHSLIKKTLEECLDHLQYDFSEGHSDVCDQCGNYNDYSKYTRQDES